MLTVRGGTGICFFLLLLVALVHFAVIRRAGSSWRDALRGNWGFVVGMCGLPVAIVFQQLLTSHWTARPYDVPLRFLLAVPIFLYLRTLPIRRLIHMHWGYTFGAFGAAAVAYNWTCVEHLGRATNYFINPVPFGNIAALLGLLSGLSIAWAGKGRLGTKLIKILGFVAGMGAAYLSETRGAWVMALVILVAVLLMTQRLGWRRRLTLIAVLLTFCAAAIHWIGPVNDRMMLVMSDIRNYDRGDYSTSLGFRVQLWRTSLAMFVEHPLVGIGDGNFNAYLRMMIAHGAASNTLADFMHAHSDILFKLAELGSVGLIAILACYIGPAMSLFRHVADTDRDRRLSARMGLVVCASLFVSGLTESMLVLTMNTAFYGLLIASLLAVAQAAREPARHAEDAR
jgi:O-antigen ligase